MNAANISDKIERDMNKLCRSCLCEVHQDYFWLDGYYLEKDIRDIYKNVTSIKIESNNCLPKKLCTPCYDNIIKFDLFKNKVLNSEKILEDRLCLAPTEIFTGTTENKAEEKEKSGNEFDYEFFDIDNQDTDLEDEIPILERLRKEIEAESVETGNENSQSKDSEELKNLDDCADEKTEPVSVLPKAKIKNSTAKKKCNKEIDEDNLERSRKRERRKESGETGNENSQSKDSEELKNLDDCADEKTEPVSVLPKAKIKNSTPKKKCNKETDKDNLERSRKRERRKESCKECGKILLAYKMENHLRTHTKEKPYKCVQCGAGFSERSNLNRHVKIHGKDRPYKCELCGKAPVATSRNQRSNLNRHVKIHGKDRPYKCELCGKGFLRPSSRAIHEMTAHRSEKDVLCPICSKGFKHQYFLKKHMANIHNKSEIKVKVDESGYPCSICNLSYKTKSSLGVHKMKHEQPRAFLCNICGNTFSTKAVLENHQRVHTGEKNFSCSICNKKFRFKGTLKTHELVHSGTKPLSCHICNKQFRQHSHLNTHMKGQHSTNRPYECSFCSKTFKHSCNLTVHTRIHTGETPYHCDICEKGFYDSSSMKKHKKGHFIKSHLISSSAAWDLDVNQMEIYKVTT